MNRFSIVTRPDSEMTDEEREQREELKKVAYARMLSVLVRPNGETAICHGIGVLKVCDSMADAIHWMLFRSCHWCNQPRIRVVSDNGRYCSKQHQRWHDKVIQDVKEAK